jgi:hypothetical protein
MMIAQRSIEAWDRMTSAIIDSAWEVFDPFWGDGEPGDDERRDLDDGEYRQMISVHDLMNM